MKTIFLHVGFGKTGTTTIQEYLFSNRESLLENGFLYPTAGLDGPAHHLLAKRNEHCWKDLLDQLTLKNHNVIISSEYFAGISAEFIFWIKSLIPLDYTLKVIFYLRRPDHHFDAWLGQAILSGEPCHETINYYNYLKEENAFKYISYIERWINFFGASSIVVRSYDRMIDSDSLSDFLSVTSLPASGLHYGRRNKKPPLELLHLLRIVRILHGPDSFEYLKGQAIKTIEFSTDANRFITPPTFRRKVYDESDCMSLSEKLCEYGLWPSNIELFSPFDNEEVWSPISSDVIYERYLSLIQGLSDSFYDELY